MAWSGAAYHEQIDYRRRTVTLKLAVAVFPLMSAAVQFTTVLPILKRLPDAGLHVTGTEPSTASLAVTL